MGSLGHNKLIFQYDINVLSMDIYVFAAATDHNAWSAAMFSGVFTQRLIQCSGSNKRTRGIHILTKIEEFI